MDWVLQKGKQEEFPARIHVLLARDAPYGVVIRRGPAKHVCFIGWDRKSDTFEVGQWLKGRIYGRRCDLSPDGRHLIYFAMNGKWDSEAKGSWTAISRAPYLKAIGLWAKGDCWDGGGLFVDSRTYWLNGRYGQQTIREPHNLLRTERHPGEYEYGGECPGVYYLRLQRDGWRLVASEELSKRCHVDVFEKSIQVGWVLRKLAYQTSEPPAGRGGYYDEHEIKDEATGTVVKKPGWEWSEVDRDRLVWCESGKLYSGHLTYNGVGRVTTLFDFNPMRFERIKAPY